MFSTVRIRLAKAKQVVGMLRESDIEEIIHSVCVLVLMLTTEWNQHMASGSTTLLWAVIEREYGASVLATERCLDGGQT